MPVIQQELALRLNWPEVFIIQILFIYMISIYIPCQRQFDADNKSTDIPAPAEQAGSASAVAETGTELGMALGIAVFGGLAAAVYKSGFAANIGQSISGAVAGRASQTMGPQSP